MNLGLHTTVNDCRYGLKRSIKLLQPLFASAVLISFNGIAIAATDLKTLNEKLVQLYPQTKFTSVAATPVPNLFEVQMGKNVAYVDATGQYFVFGHLFDMKVQKDLTAQVVDQLSAIDTRKLPLNDAIKTVKGDGSRVMYVFADPECGFCKKQEEVLQKVSDATIYTFLLPILGATSVSQATGVWCSKNRTAAWENKMLRNQRVPNAPKNCDTPIERNLALAQQLGIQGTPYLIAANGKSVSGALNAEKTEDFLDTNGVLKPVIKD
jgi:thiol:disulfide interchange protein DsbC